MCKIHTVILSGSVLRMDFPWSELLDIRVKRVVNDCGARDSILLLSQFGVLFTGMAGRVGFTGDMTERFRNRFSLFGHSGYFQDQSGTPSDVYMRERWLGLLLGDDPVPHFDRRPSGAAEGIITWLAVNAEPIKLIVYAAPFVALAAWMFTLYRTAKTGRQIALASELAVRSQLSLRDDNPVQALRFAIQSARIRNSYQAEDQLRASIAANRARFDLKHKAAVTGAKFAPDGRFVATGTASAAYMWDTNTGQLAYSKPVDVFRMFTFSPSGHILAVADRHGIHFWQTADGSEVRTLKRPGVLHLVFSDDGKYLATTSGASAQIWNVESGEMLTSLWGHQGTVVQAAFSHDGKYLALAVDEAYRVVVWDVEQSIKSPELTADHSAGSVDTGRAPHVAFSPDGKWLVATSLTGGVKAWEVSEVINQRTAKPMILAKGNFIPLTTGQGGRIAAGSTNGRVHIFAIDQNGSREIGALNASRTISDGLEVNGLQVAFGAVATTTFVTDVQFNSDMSKLLTTSADGAIKVWTALPPPFPDSDESWVLSSQLRGHEAASRAHEIAVRSASFSPKADMIVTAGADGHAYGWDTSDCEVGVVEGNYGTAALGPDKRTIALVRDYNWFSNSSSVELWKLGQQAPMAVLAKQGTPQADERIIHEPVFSPDGSQILTLGEKGLVRVWSWQDAKIVAEIHASEPIVRIRFDEAGNYVTAQNNRTQFLRWKIGAAQWQKLPDDDQEVIALRAESNAVPTVTTDDNHAVIVSMPGSSAPRRLLGHRERVHATAVSPDSRRLLSSSGDGTTRLWDIASGQAQIFQKSGDSISFSKDGSRFWIITRTRVFFYATDLQQLLQVAEDRLRTQTLSAP